MSALLLLPLLVLATGLARAQERGGDLFGHAVEGIGDLDGDGRTDLLIADDPGLRPDEEAPFLYAVSGGSGELLFTVGAGELELARGIVAAGDVDGDGLEDFAALVRVGLHSGAPLQVELRSGAGGAVLAQRELVGPGEDEWGGLALRSSADFDRDGRAELLVAGSWGCGWSGRWDDPRHTPSPRQSAVWMLSGADLEPLLHLDSEPLGPDFLGAGAALGDLDEDGVPELAVVLGDPRSGAGWIRVVSGAGGATLDEWGGPSRCWLRPKLLACEDFDGDGLSDVLVLHVEENRGVRPRITLLSGRSGELLADVARGEPDHLGAGFERLADGELLLHDDGTFWPGYGVVLGGPTWTERLRLRPVGGDPFGDHFGVSAAALGDVDGDGAPDLAIGAASAYSGGRNYGSVRLFSGRDGRQLRRITRADLTAPRRSEGEDRR